jgi:hypothetical protein
MESAQEAKGEAAGNKTAVKDASHCSGLSFSDMHTRASKLLRPMAAKYSATPIASPTAIPKISQAAPGDLTATPPAIAPATGEAIAVSSKMFMMQPNSFIEPRAAIYLQMPRAV